MTEQRWPGNEGTPSGRRRRVWRWLVVLAYTLAVAGLAAVFWHGVRGKSWDDSLSFALTVTVSAVGGQWMAAYVRRKAGRGDG
ncbi:hypothetical protein [Streptomyces griseoflavus]|uniref:hypothetical protein n=1 Tax=Streptomyces griseoflavus TaxID=35619 RepID=UPI00167D475A|nr:hypothetical protein [Streptomyces griseoflavus]